MEKSRPRKMRALLNLGQSVWLDYLHRHMTRSGELQELIDDGLRGMTSNPTIFERAIVGSADYDEDVAASAGSPSTDRDVFDGLAVRDVQDAADLFRPVYDATDGADGFVSLEVSPGVARNTEGAVQEALRLWTALDRPNVMIKIPGTGEGWPAIERCLEEGINVNITLLFSVEHYQAVADAYVRALEARLHRRQPIHRVASVASFFVSRVDAEVDRRIRAAGGRLSAFQGKAAIANARLAYSRFTDLMKSERWQMLAANGARPQRLLWASTGTKNPQYSDVMYVESLIAPDTIATVPPDTWKRFEDHGRVSTALGLDTADDARRVIEALAAWGIDFDDVNRTLEDDGIEKFANAFDRLLSAIAQRRTRSAAVAL